MKITGLDSRHSWIVAVASSIIFTFVTCPMRLGSQLFVSILDRYGADRNAASFPFALAYCARSLSGPFAGYFGEKLGLQRVTQIGCLLCAIGIGGCFFAESIIIIDICFGLIFGFGLGWATAVVPEIINQHFDRHRAKGQGIVFGGSGLGSSLFPPLLELVLLHFGTSGTFLIISAIILNSIPVTMLLNKPKPEKSESLKPSSAGESNLKTKQSSVCHAIEKEKESNLKLKFDSRKFEFYNKLANDVSDVKSTDVSEFQLHPDSIFSFVPSSLSDQNTLNSTPVRLLSYTSTEPLEFRRWQKNILERHSKQMDTDVLNNQNLKNQKQTSSVINTQVLKDQVHTPAVLNCSVLNDQIYYINNKFRTITTNSKKPTSQESSNSISVLWNPVFLLITLIQSLHFYVMYMFLTITIDIVRDKGVERDHEVYFVMALSFFDTIGRFLLASVTDHGYITVANFSAICFALIGLMCLMLVFVSGFSATLTAICLLGLILGGNTTSLPGTLNEFIEKKNRAMAMASRLLLYAPMSFTMSPLIGIFREGMGSYDGLLYMMLGMSMLCSILLQFMSRFIRRRGREERCEQR
ncbi:uncharacterized protein [Parasteatoda tepidariorum]|uniref:uncharacterized protein n=1 Tax=Parasteatoda tepidariorum TaxID=114398 RepID=UPI001C71E4AE|nr:uncharacterized protein LOC107437540 [Parasteatoda tepidariorum]